MYFLDLDDLQIVSSSPEILAKLENSLVTVRPSLERAEEVCLKSKIPSWRKIC